MQWNRRGWKFKILHFLSASRTIFLQKNMFLPYIKLSSGDLVLHWSFALSWTIIRKIIILFLNFFWKIQSQLDLERRNLP